MSVSSLATYRPDQVMEAVEGFATEINGVQYVIRPTLDRLKADHIVVRTYPHFFRPVEGDLRYETEAATDNPGEVRARQTSSAKTPAASRDKEN